MSFRSRRVLFSSWIAFVSAVLLMFPPLQAQTFRGGINGMVTDQSGAVVPGAQVEATDIGNRRIA